MKRHIIGRRKIIILVLMCFVLLIQGVALAHESRPVYVEIKEHSKHSYATQLLVPLTVVRFTLPTVVMPKNCIAKTGPIVTKQPAAYLMKQQYLCKKSIANQNIAIKFPKSKPSVSTLFRVQMLNGQVHNHMLNAKENIWKIPSLEKPWRVASDYTQFGISHIFQGFDHLLFVACLIFIACTLKRILITITGFTLAHSFTLMLSTLGIVELPVIPVEAVIALSIVFLAHEMALSSQRSWTYRYPVLVSSIFGLLHGFGFAAVLRNIGLPQTELATALLFFNFGVEIGQLIFVLLIAALFFLWQWLPTKKLAYVDKAKCQIGVSYIIGTTASFWLIQRVLLFST